MRRERHSPEWADRGLSLAGSSRHAHGGCAEQSALLCSLLGALMDQREHLIAGDAAALHRANARLAELLEAQAALDDGSWQRAPGADAAELAELFSLAARVNVENAINHLLAVRGLQFTDASLQAIESAGGPPSEAGAHVPQEPAEGLPYGLRVLDTRK